MKPVALVTGGSRGIGLGIAKALAHSQFDLAINGVRPEGAVTSTLDELRYLGCEVLYCQGNIAESTARKNILDKIQGHFNRLNLLVNNAGIAPKERVDVLDTREDSFDQLMGINLKGPFFLSQQVAKWMLEQKIQHADFKASIINVTSISAQVASINRGEYCMSKAALSMMTKLFAVRLGQADISVFEIQPGIIETDMTSGVKEKYDKLIGEGISLQKRWGQPEDIGKAVAMLARNDLSFSTGQVLQVDGGFSVARL